MNRLDGEIALISGGRGIGAETARRTVEARGRVIVGDILDERAPETAHEIGGGDTAATYYQRRRLERAIGAAVAQWGGLDILVNNAGLFLGEASSRRA
jgi:3alpha(or 20beta)-hydroxysteroid dehydrogenase